MHTGEGIRLRALIATAIIMAIIVVALTPHTISADEEEEKGEYAEAKQEYIDHTEEFREAGITKYEGSATCIECHRDEVVEFFHSYHYQLYSIVNDVSGYSGIPLGSRYVYNDFCGAIFWNGTKPINWIGYVVLKKAPEGYEDLVGQFTGLTGCSMCHGVGMGLPPSSSETEEQLGNIDCLACHADPDVYISGPLGIKKGVKTVYKDENGVWHYNVTVDIWKIAKSIIRTPKKENCLACHAFSGGGPHLKRPNLSPDLMGTVSEDFDVHMARGMSCVDCHKGEGHAFPTKAADTWDREEGDVAACESCHGSDPHEGVKGFFLNKFHDKVACQTCHIPYIAHGKYPTALRRDWSAATFHPELKRWKFSIPDPETGAIDKWYLDSNVTPVYMWYNGEREVYVYPNPIEPIKGDELELSPVNGRSLGVIYYVKPLGSKDDPNAKIYPFKLHRAVVPYSVVNKTLVPIKVGIAFATGNVTLATLVGAKEAGLVWEPGDYVTLVRYMQVDHGVQPAENALSCLDCHGPTVRRMPWQELGYGVYPEIAFTALLAAAVAIVAGIVYLILRRFGVIGRR